jgi:hypothetical protein
MLKLYFRCQYCDKCCKSPYEVKKHMKKVHGDIMDAGEG